MTESSTEAKTSPASDLEAKGWRAWWSEIFGADLVNAFAPHHAEAVEWHWNARQALKRGEKPDYSAYFAIFSRGHMKSTLARRIAICDAALSGTGYCLYVGGTKEKVKGHAISLETLLSSPKVLEYYPGLGRVRKSAQKTSKGWQQQFIYTDHGYVFHFVSLDQGVAGANVDNLRPTLIVPDDIDDREDSPAVSEKRFQVFTRGVLPTKTKDTLFFFAQNLISRYSIAYRIYKQKVRVLVDRFPTHPIPAVRGLVTEEQTIDGIIRDTIVDGVSTWPAYGLDRAQEDINTYGLPAFLLENQHEVEQQRSGAVLPEWDESVHVITWSEFASVFGWHCGCRRPDTHAPDKCPKPTVPHHWQKHIGHDWGAIHPCVVSAIAVSAENSKLPGLHFLYAGLTFPQNTIEDDVAMAMIERLFAIDCQPVRDLSPELVNRWAGARVTDILNAPREAAKRILRGQVQMRLSADRTFRTWRMSHEQATIRDVYGSFYGLPFDACNPGASGGIQQIRSYLRTDYKLPHLFRQGKQGLTGFYLIVADDQRETPRDDRGLKLWRDQFPEWMLQQYGITESGLKPDKPLKVHDDAGNSIMFIYHDLPMRATPLTHRERVERTIPENLRIENLRASRPEGLTPSDEMAYVLARQDAEKQVKKRGGYQRFDQRLKPKG